MRKRWQKLAAGLSCIVMFCTIYALVLPAVTLESGYFCGQAEHTHTNACYERELICKVQEGEAHAHTSECYGTETERILICGQHVHTDACYEVKTEATLNCNEHVHRDSCYRIEANLICGQEEHTHSEECYGEDGVLNCQLHVHGEDCYQQVKTLICTQSGHEHVDACYIATETDTLICGEAVTDVAHSHSGECYENRSVLICQMEENVPHTHTDDCYADKLICQQEEHTHNLVCQSNPNADVETADDWENKLPQELSGIWADSLLAIAKSQLGYAESDANYAVSEDGEMVTGHYTRYGAWYGNPYGNWDAMFVSFCLHYAQIPTDAVPRESDTAQWVKKLSGQAQGYENFDLYREVQSYTPRPGDLVFFDTDRDEKADRVGIVTEYNGATEVSGAVLKTIEGSKGEVRSVTYELDTLEEQENLRILGYVQLPEKPEPLCGKEEHTHTELCYSPDPDGGEALLTCAVEAHTHTEECYLQPGREYRYEDETLLVTVVLPADSQVPETAELLVMPITQEEDRYSQLEQQAQDAIAGTLTQIVLYDLSFYTGEAYLPVEDSAVVTITFLQGQLSEPAEQVTVLHYAQEEAAPVALREVEVQRDENEELSGLTFQTEGFSTYAVVLSNDPVAYAADEAALTLYPGQVRTVEVYGNTCTSSSEETVTVSEVTHSSEELQLGSDSTFAGDYAAFENALYTFTEVTSGYTIKSKEKEIYLNLGTIGVPGSTTQDTFVVGQDANNFGVDLDDGIFGIKSNTNNKLLYFHRSGGKLYQFDRNSIYDGTGCPFLIYKKGGPSSAEISGYVQVEKENDIVSGEAYLIVAEAGGAYFVLYPSMSTEPYSHVAKVVPSTVTVTAKAAGTATVTAGTTTLNVTVTNEITVYAGKTVQIELPAGAKVTENENTGVATVEIDENGMATVTGVAAGTTAVTIMLGDDTYTWRITTKGTLVPGVTPAGTVINLFDYWVKGENEGQVGYFDQGINTDHVLKFSSNGESDVSIGHVNKWTGADGGVLQGIVNSALTNGYPVTAVNESLGINKAESLAYLFDPSTECAYRKAYSNVSNLLQVDASGYYYYDSTKNYAEFNPDSDSFLLYDDWAVTFQPSGGTENNGQFFPFDDYSSVTKETPADNTSTKLNHFFGMTLTTRFVQKQNGLTDAGANMTFAFSGDDDVWIFVDNVLIADLGGIHDKAGVTIDFADGTVSIDRVYNEEGQSVKYFADFFDESDLENGIFKDNTYHTLRFFYLERGGNASNLSLKYNLSSYPATAITKVNQYGEPLAGVKFTVKSENRQEYSYTTDSNGQIVFVDDEGMPLSPDEIKSKFGDRFTLEETGVPAGYRKVGEPAELHFEKGVLVCDNTYTTGVWADPNLLVTAPRILKLQTPYGDKTEITYYGGEANITGSVFAVVLKYVGSDRGNASPANLAKEENWKPVYGTVESGYQLADTSDGFTQAVKYAAGRYTESQNVFRLASNGSMQGTLNGMPGDITKYYYMLDDKGKTEYTVAYYWTPEEITNTSDIAGLAEIHPINSYGTEGNSVFGRTFGATINVPNVSNRVLVQKLDESGTPVDGAVFAVYKAEESDGNIFYQADDAQIRLEKDTDGDNKGGAQINGTAENYEYEVNPQTGAITVQAAGTTKTITPVMTGTTQPAAQNGMGEDGIVSFAGADLVTGKYYIREISAPVGYKLNTQEIMMLITDTALYVNAGTEGDGIRVGRGPGFLVNTMEYAASNGDIDNTLTWIYTQLKASEVSSKFSDVTYENYKNWQYVTNSAGTKFTKTRSGALTAYLKYSAPNRTGGSAANDQVLLNYILNEERTREDTEHGSQNRRLYTDVGWSYLEIYQDYVWGVENKNSSANYADLQEEGLLVDKETGKADGNIANLFSRSVYVQVTDEREPCILEISKTVSGAPDDNSNMFEFNVELKDKDGGDLKDSYAYKVYSVGENGERTEVSDGSGTIKNGGTITLKNGQIAVIEGLPCDAAYKITEALNSSYSTKVVAKVEGKTDQDGVYSPGEKTRIGTTVEGKLYWHTDNGKLDNVSSVAFTNTYLAGLSIRKVAKMSDAPLSGAEFQFTKDENGKTWYYSEDDSSGSHWVKNETYLTTDEEGLIVLESIGAGTYTLTETKAPAGYLQLTSPITVIVDADGKITGATMGNKSLIDEVSDGKQLTIKNSTGYKLPETGGKGVQIYRWPGLALMLAACLYVLWGKKKSRHCHNAR